MGLQKTGGVSNWEFTGYEESATITLLGGRSHQLERYMTEGSSNLDLTKQEQ